MEKLKEDVEITVKESSNKIKEYSTAFNLDQKGDALHITDPIDGILKYILIEVEGLNSHLLRITREKYKSFLILEDKALKGIKTYFPKYINVATDATILDLAGGHYSEIAIPNDRLEISIQGGQANSPVRLTCVWA